MKTWSLLRNLLISITRVLFIFIFHLFIRILLLVFVFIDSLLSILLVSSSMNGDRRIFARWELKVRILVNSLRFINHLLKFDELVQVFILLKFFLEISISIWVFLLKFCKSTQTSKVINVLLSSKRVYLFIYPLRLIK
jgi:hypothetical protein